MAKKQADNGQIKVGDFALTKTSASDIKNKLGKLRSGIGGKTSKYEPVADWLENNLKSDEDGLEMDLDKNEVGGLRGYLRRRFEHKYDVSSAKDGEDNYKVFIRLTTADELAKIEADNAKAEAEGSEGSEEETAEDQAPVEA